MRVMAIPPREDAAPEDSGVIPEQTRQEDEQQPNAIVLSAPSSTVYQTEKLSATISPDLVRNPSTRILLTYGVEGMERTIDRQNKELASVRAELKSANERSTELTVNLALCRQDLQNTSAASKQDLDNARKEQNTASTLITIGMFSLGAAVEFRSEHTAVWALVGLIGLGLAVFGWLGFRENRGKK